MTLSPGATLGRYQILEPLGQGGMAVVYKAFQPALERTVALKVIRRGFADDPEFRERFQREAKAIARLTHPNIVDVFDFDEVEGQVFLAMQYLEGGTLRDRLASLAGRGERMLQDQTAGVVSQVASALEYAHKRGVIHRDIKPSNVILSEEGAAVVTDFGIAKIIGGTQYTATGVGMGTPEYMSPEQGQGLPLDGRTDQYALAVMAYEMLTGSLPYTADTPFAVVLKHVRDPLPLPSRVDPGVSARAEQVLLRALAKDPAQRYPSVTEFAGELSTAIAERPGRTLPTVISPRPGAAKATRPGAPPSTRSITLALPALTLPAFRPLTLAAAALAFLLLGGGGAAVLGAFRGPGPSPTPLPTLAVAAATTAPPTTEPPPATAPPTTVPPTTPPPTTPPPTPTPTPRPTTPPPTTAPPTPTPPPTTAPPTPRPTSPLVWSVPSAFTIAINQYLSFEPFKYQLCRPGRTDLYGDELAVPCGSQLAATNPSGGTPPYTFWFPSHQRAPEPGTSFASDIGYLPLDGISFYVYEAGLLSAHATRDINRPAGQFNKETTIEVCAVDAASARLCRQITFTPVR